MKKMLIIIVAATLFTACQRKGQVSSSTTEASKSVQAVPAIAAWGATKDEILTKLAAMKATVLTNTGDFIAAEVGPEGLTSSDGRPITHPLRTEYYFKDGKLAHTKCFP